MFEALTASIHEDFVKYIYRVELVRQDQPPQAPKVQRVQENRDEVASGAGGARWHGGGRRRGGRQPGNPNQAISDKTPRNAPVPVRQRQEVQEVPRRRGVARRRVSRRVSAISWIGFSGPKRSSSAAGRNPRAR